MEFITTSSRETQQVAELLGKEIKERLSKIPQSFVLAFFGELGSGKTTFIQGLAKGLGIKEVVNSPSFILISKFQVPSSKFSFFHIDPYRLDQSEAVQELKKLGIEEILSEPGSVAAIEWADKIQKLLPAERIDIYLEHLNGDKRRIKVKTISNCSNV
jgi:tRNA threonylcarbamoyladenosine biosynthesis protein TsaE